MDPLLCACTQQCIERHWQNLVGIQLGDSCEKCANVYLQPPHLLGHVQVSLQEGIPQAHRDRYASYFLLLERMLEVQPALQAMVVTLEWSRWAESKTDEGKKIRVQILDNDWWQIVVIWCHSYGLQFRSFATLTQILLVLEKSMRLLIACWVK